MEQEKFELRLEGKKLAQRRKSPQNIGNNMRSSLSERNDQAYIKDSEKINLCED